MSDQASRRRLYDRYVSTHLGRADVTVANRYFEANLARYLPADRHTKILDIGCGAGLALAFLRGLGYNQCAGIDFSPEQVSLAHASGLLDVIEGDFLQFIEAARDSFDVVLAFDVLEHLKLSELLATLDAVLLALRPGGRLIIQTANAEGPFGGRYAHWDVTHETVFTSSSLLQCLKVAGFAEISIYESRIAIHGLKSAMRSAIWRLLRFLLIVYLAVETGVIRGHVLTQNMLAVAVRDG